MQIYLAGCYSRHAEIAGYARDLQEAGHTVTSRWVLAPKRQEGELTGPELHQCAVEDTQDIIASNCMILFTGEVPPSSGHHVESGMAMILMLPILIVGPRESIFHEGYSILPAWDYFAVEEWLESFALGSVLRIPVKHYRTADVIMDEIEADIRVDVCEEAIVAMLEVGG